MGIFPSEKKYAFSVPVLLDDAQHVRMTSASLEVLNFRPNGNLGPTYLAATLYFIKWAGRKHGYFDVCSRAAKNRTETLLHLQLLLAILEFTNCVVVAIVLQF